MAGQITRLQVSGHRFHVRRMHHALVRADVRMLDDPLRAQSLSLSAGAVVAVIAVTVCMVLAVLRPAADVGAAPIVLVPETGALYVTVEGTVHPVPNLASARLVTGSTDPPKSVSQPAIDRSARGAALGIPGAPVHFGPPLSAQESQWTVCDDEHGATTVFADSVADTAVRSGGSVLVAVRGNAALTYLLHGGWRSRVDLRQPAVVRALKLDGVAPREVSPALLSAMPEAPPIAPPPIPAAGTAGPSTLGGLPVGAVFAASGVDGEHLYVVLSDGVQRIGPVTADLIRYSDARAENRIPVLAPDVVGTVAVRTTLAVNTFPDQADIASPRVICVGWRADRAEDASPSAVLLGEELPASPAAVRLAQADGPGPAVDSVGIPAGRSVYVRSVGIAGGGYSSGASFLVADTGVAFGVGADDSAARLGLIDPPAPAPWPVLSTLPRGPELSRSAASVAWDGAA
ncbi:type VII secretion protein EccB [Mycobacterium sp. SMC-4]|uniref:type VII secretion protein EccB n=1 Tax=Mycobacterium sp. SMC-4 TaxID=2857059 RepID=UPI003D0585DF